jgi:hypothetical protein
VKSSKQAMVTHFLENIERVAYYNSERKQVRSTHRLKSVNRAISRHSEKASKQEHLQTGEYEREGQIRTARKVSMWSTHRLESMEGTGGTS